MPEPKNALDPKLEQGIKLGAEVLDKVQDTLHGGRIKAVRIKLGNHTIREIPVQAAALSAVLIAAAAILISQLRVEVEKG